MTVSNLVQSESIIDREDLLTRCMGNLPFALRILQSFQDQLSTDLNELETAIAKEELSLAATIAHRVKGASSNVSAGRLCRLATLIGEYAADNRIDLLQLCASTIRDEQQRFLEAVQELHSTSDSAS